MLRTGIARLTAEVVNGTTCLTELSHCAPARLFEVRSPNIIANGAAAFYVGGFGGGLLGGDRVRLDVEVGSDATVVGRTQGTTKIYKAKSDNTAASQILRARVQNGGLLVLAPDPVMPFARAKYDQHQRFEVAEHGSVVTVDSVNSGRVARGERWSFSSFGSRNEYANATSAAAMSDEGGGGGSSSSSSSSTRIPQEEVPFLVDATRLHAADQGASNWGMDLGGRQRDGFASIVAVGPRAAPVRRAMSRLAVQLAARSGARVMEESLNELEATAHRIGLPALSGEVHMGVTHAPPTSVGRDDVAIARVVAEFSEDLLRVIAACLEPLASELGEAPYADRIHGKGDMTMPQAEEVATRAAGEASRDDIEVEAPMSSAEKASRIASDQGLEQQPREAQGGLQQWALMQLADPTLPIGGFAHSGGFEAALQLGVLRSRRTWTEAAVVEFHEAAARTNAQLYVPFAAASHAWAVQMLQKAEEVGSVNAARQSAADYLEEESLFLQHINEQLTAQLAGTSPALRASVLQGSALLQALDVWLTGDGQNLDVAAVAVLQRSKSALPPSGVHFACAMGLAGALLRLGLASTVEAMAFTTSRALLSAAVRLNLVGPQRALAVQVKTARAWLRPPEPSDGDEEAMSQKKPIAPGSLSRVSNTAIAASTSPLIESIHAAHQLLEARAFQT